MAKQRNSLGVLVLPVPDNETLTWEEYKEKYGIDLDKIVEVINSGDDDNPDYSIMFKADFRKLIAISCAVSTIMPCVSFPSRVVMMYNSSPADAYTSLQCSDVNQNGGYGLSITADRHISGGEM